MKSTFRPVPVQDYNLTKVQERVQQAMDRLAKDATQADTDLVDTNPTTVATTGNYIVQATDGLVMADATLGVVTVTLPDPSLSTGRTVAVKRVQAGGSNVTVACAGSGTVESGTLTAQNMSRVWQAAGNTWVIVAGYL